MEIELAARLHFKFSLFNSLSSHRRTCDNFWRWFLLFLIEFKLFLFFRCHGCARFHNYWIFSSCQGLFLEKFAQRLLAFEQTIRIFHASNILCFSNLIDSHLLHSLIFGYLMTLSNLNVCCFFILSIFTLWVLWCHFCIRFLWFWSFWNHLFILLSFWIDSLLSRSCLFSHFNSFSLPFSNRCLCRLSNINCRNSLSRLVFCYAVFSRWAHKFKFNWVFSW